MSRRSGWSGTVPARPAGFAAAPWSWVAVSVAGWLAGQVVAAVSFGAVASAFVVAGTASGVAAAEALDGAERVLTAGTPVVALALVQVPMWATQLAAVAAAAAGAGRRWRDALGWRFRPADVPVGIVAGVGAQLLIGVAYTLAGVEADGPARQLISRGSGPAGAVALLVLLAVGAPVVEELLFRGVLQQGLAARLPGPAAVGVTSLLFAAVHFQAVQFPGLLVAGVVFGTLARRSGRLGPAVVAHMAFNAGTVLLMVLS